MQMSKQGQEFYPHWSFQENGRRYLYSSISNRILELDSVAENYLDLGVKESQEYDYEAMAETLADAFIIKTEKNEKQLKHLEDHVDQTNMPYITAATMMISQACNLRCVYCYGENGEYHNKGFMSFATAKQTIDWLINNTGNDIELSIIFFGGEPLLSFSLIKEITEYGEKVAMGAKRILRYSMTTNGILITKEVQEYLREHKIATQISMDGVKETQDANRYYMNKQGCYDDVIEHTKELRKEKLLGVRATISPKSLDVMENLNHLLQLGFKRVAWASASNLMDNHDYVKLLESTKQLISYIENLIVEGKYQEARKYIMVIKVFDYLDNPEIRMRSCGAGRHMMAIDIGGNVYPCHRFVGIDEFCLGNIKDLNNDEIGKKTYYSQLGVIHFEKCRECKVRGLCVGACLNENYFETGAITEPREAFCNYIQNIYKEIIRMFVRLTPEQRDGLRLK